MENKSKEVEEAMALLMKTQKEREEIEQNREELMRRIEDEKEKTSLYREAIIQLKENLEDEKKSKELMEEGTRHDTTRHDQRHDTRRTVCFLFLTHKSCVCRGCQQTRRRRRRSWS